MGGSGPVRRRSAEGGVPGGGPGPQGRGDGARGSRGRAASAGGARALVVGAAPGVSALAAGGALTSRAGGEWAFASAPQPLRPGPRGRRRGVEAGGPSRPAGPGEGRGGRRCKTWAWAGRAEARDGPRAREDRPVRWRTERRVIILTTTTTDPCPTPGRTRGVFVLTLLSPLDGQKVVLRPGLRAAR